MSQQSRNTAAMNRGQIAFDSRLPEEYWSDDGREPEEDTMTKTEIIDDLLNLAEAFNTKCPCCTANKTCGTDCTFMSDAPDGYEQMEFQRELMARVIKIRESVEKL